MLVLARKRGEAILISDNITITVLDVQGGKVKLGFSAPEQMPINRKEVQDKKNSLKQNDAEQRSNKPRNDRPNSNAQDSTPQAQTTHRQRAQVCGV